MLALLPFERAYAILNWMDYGVPDLTAAVPACWSAP